MVMGVKPTVMILGLLSLLVTAGVGCSSSGRSTQDGSHSPSAGTVTGTLQLVGGPSPGTKQPVPGVVYAFASANLTGKPSAQTSAAANGRFTFNLSPGTYFLAATSPQFQIDPAPTTPPCRAQTAVTVSSGMTLDAEVMCPVK